MTRRVGLGLALLLVVCVGCSPANGDRPTPIAESPGRACVRPSPDLTLDASLAGRDGEYRLTLVEEVDGAPARSAEGTMVLLPQDESLQRFRGSTGGEIPGVTSPLFGRTDVRLESVGAVRVGDLSSVDPAAPGVLVIESRTGADPNILLRLGSDANRRDLVRFDGGYTVLTLAEMSDTAFGGTWTSGIRGPESNGFFCAIRIR